MYRDWSRRSIVLLAVQWCSSKSLNLAPRTLYFRNFYRVTKSKFKTNRLLGSLKTILNTYLFIYIDILLSGLSEPDAKGKKGKKKNNSKKTLTLQTFLHNKVVCRGVYIFFKNRPPTHMLAILFKCYFHWIWETLRIVASFVTLCKVFVRIILP